MAYQTSSYLNLNANEEHYLVNLSIYDCSLNEQALVHFSSEYIDIDINYSVLSNRIVFEYTVNTYSYATWSGVSGNTISFNFSSFSDIKNNGTYKPNQILNVPFTNYVSVQSGYFDIGARMVLDTWYDDSLGLTDQEYGEIYGTGYTDGYSEGYSSGKTVGYNDGFHDGQSDTGMFTLLGTAFDSASSLYDIQIIGGLSIGTFIMIPVAIAVLTAIFKLIRK